MVAGSGISQKQSKPWNCLLQKLCSSGRMIRPVLFRGISVARFIFLGAITCRRPEVVLDIQNSFSKIMRSTKKSRQNTATETASELLCKQLYSGRVLRQKFRAGRVNWINMSN